MLYMADVHGQKGVGAGVVRTRSGFPNVRAWNLLCW